MLDLPNNISKDTVHSFFDELAKKKVVKKVKITEEIEQNLRYAKVIFRTEEGLKEMRETLQRQENLKIGEQNLIVSDFMPIK